MDHKLDTNYTDKKGKTWAFRCSVCYKKWANKPTSQCSGAPNFSSMGNNKGSPQGVIETYVEDSNMIPLNKTPKKQTGSGQKTPDVNFLGGELYKIQRQFPPQQAKDILKSRVKEASWDKIIRK